jgi:hypothetical protein
MPSVLPGYAQAIAVIVDLEWAMAVIALSAISRLQSRTAISLDLNKSFTITADVEVPSGGGNGMLVTAGGRFGGWGFYLLKGKPVFVYNLLDLARPRIEGSAALTPGRHTVEFDFKYDGPGLGKGGTGTIKVDGVEAGSGIFPQTIPFALEASETFDVGSDTGTGVDDEDYQTPFAFDGKLNKLTLAIEKPKLTPEDEKKGACWQLRGVGPFEHRARRASVGSTGASSCAP